MVVNDNAQNRMLSGALRFFASKLAPTVILCFTYIQQTASPQRSPRLRCAASHPYIAEGPA
ncbi:hypothetical protein DOZ80_06500 [Pseudomonas fluorescens]|uniref:Uncharacterized protein n=1 Tax=Pseudomonas fluorescens TaxID=294 RepID=A0A327N9R3_PSEFL|nr:hypothetical protein DOZ80_06500 [Pseudomonas fluorescens]